MRKSPVAGKNGNACKAGLHAICTSACAVSRSEVELSIGAASRPFGPVVLPCWPGLPNLVVCQTGEAVGGIFGIYEA